MTAPVFERITIIGLGLIGSSIARAVKKFHAADIVAGCDLNADTLAYARARAIVDFAFSDPRLAVAESQLVVLATPPAHLDDVARQIAPGLAAGALVMDTASVKLAAIQAIEPYLPAHAIYIPAHPIAGGEQSGISAGRADLFEKKQVIITPPYPPQGDLLQKITRFWQGLGARLEGMPPELHDMLYAYVSHLPQLLSFGLRGLVQPGESDTLARFTRLQHSNPDLWTEIFLLNASPLLSALDRYLDALAHMHKELSQAPAEEKSAPPAAAQEMLAHIAAACLATTLMEAEKKSGFGYVRFGGTGLRDFLAPAETSPETHIEAIASHGTAMAAIIARYIESLAALRAALAATDASRLRSLL